MRTLGPGSVSSFLKVAVEVIYAALWVLLAIQAVAVATLLIAEPLGLGLLRLSPYALHITGAPRMSADGPAVAVVLCVSALYVGVLLVICGQMRRVLDTLTRGDPFHPANVRRLRVMGLALVSLEALGYLSHVAVKLFARTDQPWALSFNGAAWFAILVVFVLAEVFREGARLRQEAELTV
jgi:hypothetical protein